MSDSRTQSVCKHCRKEIKNIAGTWYEASLMKKAIDAADAILAGACSVDGKLCRHEPLSEPASTGDPKPEIDICAELRKGLAAARPSEPSAPHKLGCHFPDTPCMCNTITVVDAAPQTSASLCLHCNNTRWKVIAGDGCAVQDRTILCPHCAPQPVLAPAPSPTPSVSTEPGPWFGAGFEWLKTNGYKELGQIIHYENNGHVGYKYPHEILDIYAQHLAAAPSVAGTQPTPYKNGDAQKWFEDYCYEHHINFAKRIETGGEDSKRLDELILEILEAFLDQFLAQGTPQVEEAHDYEACNSVACQYCIDLTELAENILQQAGGQPEAREFVALLVSKFNRKHLVGAPAQPGPEEKK